MNYRRTAAGLFLATLVCFLEVGSAKAQSLSEFQNRAYLLNQIAILTAEVERLTNLSRVQTPLTFINQVASTPYQTMFLDLPVETIYPVVNGELSRGSSGQPIRVVDQQLFDLLSDTWGHNAVKKYLKEWRVFSNPNFDLGAFVELTPYASAWVAGVNRANFSTESGVLTSYANLFVHEYAHILIEERPELLSTFEQSFWKQSDYEHSVVATNADLGERFPILRRYYENQPSRFVSDYATLSPEEDWAETFLDFVRGEIPEATSLRNQKILSLYQYSELVLLRAQLRANLIALKAL